MVEKRDLILLVGTNPLPNYVVAQFLKKETAKIFLVHTQETKGIAQGLRDVLSDKETIHLVELESEWDASKIGRNLGRRIDRSPNLKLHLNYTGGTKAMAVHVYQWVKENCPDAWFSYLDARSHKLVYDNGREESPLLTEVVHIESIDDLLKLHSYSRTSEKVEQNPFPVSLGLLLNLVNCGKIAEFIGFKNRVLGGLYHDGGKWIDKGSVLKDHLSVRHELITQANKEINEHRELKELLGSFPEKNSILHGGTLWTPTAEPTTGEVNRRVGECLKKYLDGKWLEFHVYNVLHELIAESNEEGWLQGISLEAKSRNDKKFELDIYAVKGYRLFGISVTTADWYHAKSKAFEVIHRVRQIGGDEAKAMLIAHIPHEGEVDSRNATHLGKDVAFLSTGSEGAHFKVLGTEKWRTEELKEELRGFLWD